MLRASKILNLHKQRQRRAKLTKSALEEFRTRWRRWLGNKTRWDQSYWTTLLDSNWIGWADKVLSLRQPGYTYHGLSFTASREEIKMLYAQAIDVAMMDDLVKLDSLYAQEKWKL